MPPFGHYPHFCGFGDTSVESKGFKIMDWLPPISLTASKKKRKSVFLIAPLTNFFLLNYKTNTV